MTKRFISLLLTFCLLASCASALAETAPAESPADLFTQYFTSGEYQKAWDMLGETMKAALSAEDLQAAWDGLCSPMGLGAFESVYSAETAPEPVQGMILTTVLLKYASDDTLAAMSLAADAQGLISGLSINMVPHPEAPALSALEEALVVGQGTDFPLNAVLSMPASDEPVPAVVLVHGSGANDMDETLGPNKPFKDIADFLVSQGIAVLRYDKRPYAHGKLFMDTYGMHYTVYEETIDDAILAKTLLDADPRIDPNRIYVLGHSLGGMLAPIIASEGGYAGMIIMAGTTRALPEVMVEQYEYIYGLDASMALGAPLPEEEKNALLAGVHADYDRFLEAMSLPEDEWKEISLFGASAYYFVHMAKLPLAETLTSFEGPILIQQGKMDYQIRYESDFSIYETLTAGMENVTLTAYDGLTHLFTPSFSETGLGVPADYEHPAHVDTAPLQDIAEFILGAES